MLKSRVFLWFDLSFYVVCFAVTSNSIRNKAQIKCCGVCSMHSRICLPRVLFHLITDSLLDQLHAAVDLLLQIQRKQESNI